MELIHRNKLCPVCFKKERGFGFNPSLKGKRGKLTFYCSLEHLKQMTDQHLENEEEPLLWEAIVSACQYLDNLEVHDMRHLTKGQLVMFASIVISKFEQVHSAYAKTKQTQLDLIDDEIPF